jgi:lipopolysaccharide export system permease protein
LEKQKILLSASSKAETTGNDWNFKSIDMKQNDKNLRKHEIGWHEKLTLSLACLIFFFIGAPLGGIIRKGGLGLPVVISVLIFIFYYIVNNTGVKMAREGEWIVWMGVWTSTAVLAPIGAFLTYKSNKDSVILNADAYINWIKNVLGIRSVRHLVRKEVIIEDPDYQQLPASLQQLTNECLVYSEKKHLRSAPNYFKLWWAEHQRDEEMVRINDQMETLIDEMSNTQYASLINLLNNYPIIPVYAHVRPFKQYWLNLLCGALIPIGLFFYFRIWIFRLRLMKDVEKIVKNNNDIINLIKEQNLC